MGGTAVARHLGPIEVDRIFLYEENPRHEPIETEPEIIEHLCKDEQVYNLARSIADAGPNPLELLGLVEAPDSGSKKTYQAWEGNRRVCAIKLLNDPDRAPAHLRKDFARLSAESGHVPIKKINCVVFDDHNDLKFWMGIIHDGFQGGVGRIDWNADQKARHFGTSSRNRLALAVLDAAQDMNLISKEEREGRLTTAQRYLNSSIVREAIGIDNSNPEDIAYNRPTDEFKKQLSRFIDDLKEGSRVTSRNNRPQIDAYGRTLARSKGISDQRIAPQSLKTAVAATSKASAKRRTKPKQPRKLAHLDFNKELSGGLEAIRNSKLENLYYSLCQVHIQHAPLLTIGLWAFIESLCALAGKNDTTDFVSFYSKQKMAALGITEKAAIREALNRIQRNGNSTKHHEVAASFDGRQLSNDLETLTPLLIKTVESIPPKK
jgi:hypothetical protein